MPAEQAASDELAVGCARIRRRRTSAQFNRQRGQSLIVFRAKFGAPAATNYLTSQRRAIELRSEAGAVVVASGANHSAIRR